MSAELTCGGCEIAIKVAERLLLTFVTVSLRSSDGVSWAAVTHPPCFELACWGYVWFFCRVIPWFGESGLSTDLISLESCALPCQKLSLPHAMLPQFPMQESLKINSCPLAGLPSFLGIRSFDLQRASERGDTVIPIFNYWESNAQLR